MPRRPTGGDTGRALGPVVLAPVVVPVVGRVLERGTRNPIAGAVISVDTAVAGETDADGRFQLTLPAGRHDLAVLVGGKEVVRRQIDLSPGTPADEQIFRVLTADSGARYATKVRAGHPEIPKVEVSGEEARQTARLVRRSDARARFTAGRRADRLAGVALRGARGQSGQHRLLPGRHPRAGAVSPGRSSCRSSIPI